MHAISEQQKEGTDFWHLFSCVCVCFQFYEGRALGKLDFYLELLHQWRSSHHLRYSMTVLSVHWTHAHQKADNFIECYSKCFHWIKCFFFFSIKPTKYCDFCYLNYAFIRASSFLECKSRSIHRGKGMKAAQLSFSFSLNHREIPCCRRGSTRTKNPEKGSIRNFVCIFLFLSHSKKYPIDHSNYYVHYTIWCSWSPSIVFNLGGGLQKVSTTPAPGSRAK